MAATVIEIVYAVVDLVERSEVGPTLSSKFDDAKLNTVAGLLLKKGVYVTAQLEGLIVKEKDLVT